MQRQDMCQTATQSQRHVLHNLMIVFSNGGVSAGELFCLARRPFQSIYWDFFFFLTAAPPTCKGSSFMIHDCYYWLVIIHIDCLSCIVCCYWVQRVAPWHHTRLSESCDSVSSHNHSWWISLNKAARSRCSPPRNPRARLTRWKWNLPSIMIQTYWIISCRNPSNDSLIILLMGSHDPDTWSHDPDTQVTWPRTLHLHVTSHKSIHL